MQTYAEIPGTCTYILPPLVFPSNVAFRRDKAFLKEAETVVKEFTSTDDPKESSQHLNLLIKNYTEFFVRWQTGEMLVAWARECESITSQWKIVPTSPTLIWPPRTGIRYVRLICEKGLGPPQQQMEKAVGLRLIFAHPPNVSGFAPNSQLFKEQEAMAMAAYNHDWVNLAPTPLPLFPPDRFNFEVFKSSELEKIIGPK